MIMISTELLLVACAMLGCIFGCVKLSNILNRKRRDDEPPLVPGHALFGNSVQFQQNAVRFLLGCASKFGDIFTLRFLHHYMTIVMDVHAYQDFCRAETFDFDPIQKQVNRNVFNFVVRNPKVQIRESSKTVRGKQYKQTISVFCKYMNEAINDYAAPAPTASAQHAEWKHEGLRVAAANMMFSPIFYTLFGAMDKAAVFNPHNVHVLLTKFHKYFNHLWMGLPIQLFPEANKSLQTMLSVSPSAAQLLAKDDAIPYIRIGTKCMLEAGQSDEDVKKLNLVLVHVNYNTFRVTFWALYHLLLYAQAREAVQNEVRDFLSSRTADGKVQLSTDDLASLPILDSFVKETFRVSSGVFMVRTVTEDTKFAASSGRVYTIRKGDKIAIYPPAIHQDPEIFSEPEKFIYDRFIEKVFYKSGREVRNPLLAFGSLCPGQLMAITQLKLFLLAWCSQIEAELLPNERTGYDKTCYGHEILPPDHDVQIRYRRVATLEFNIE